MMGEKPAINVAPSGAITSIFSTVQFFMAGQLINAHIPPTHAVGCVEVAFTFLISMFSTSPEI